MQVLRPHLTKVTMLVAMKCLRNFLTVEFGISQWGNPHLSEGKQRKVCHCWGFSNLTAVIW